MIREGRTGGLRTQAERQTSFFMAKKITRAGETETLGTALRMFTDLPQEARETLTFDNGLAVMGAVHTEAWSGFGRNDGQVRLAHRGGLCGLWQARSSNRWGEMVGWRALMGPALVGLALVGSALVGWRAGGLWWGWLVRHAGDEK